MAGAITKSQQGGPDQEGDLAHARQRSAGETAAEDHAIGPTRQYIQVLRIHSLLSHQGSIRSDLLIQSTI